MDIRFKTILDLVKTKSYTKTSRNLNLTQPAITVHVKSLEQEYNITIFIKENKRIIDLNDDGNLLVDYIKKVLLLERNFDLEIRKKKQKIITMAIASTLKNHPLINKMIENYLKDINPNKVYITYQSNNLLTNLDEGKCDFVITDEIFDKDKYQYRRLFKEEIVFLMNPQNPLYQRRNIGLNTLKNEMIMISSSSFFKHLDKLDLNYNIVELDNLINLFLANNNFIYCDYQYKMAFFDQCYKRFFIPELKAKDIYLLTNDKLNDIALTHFCNY